MPKDYEAAIAKLSAEDQKNEVIVLRALLACYLGDFANIESDSKLIAFQVFFAKKTGFTLRYVQSFASLFQNSVNEKNPESLLNSIHQEMSGNPFKKTGDAFWMLKTFFKKFPERAKKIISSGGYPKESSIFQAASTAKREIERAAKVQYWVQERMNAIAAESSWENVCVDIALLASVKLEDNEVQIILGKLLHRIQGYIFQQLVIVIDEVEITFDLLNGFLKKYPGCEEQLGITLLQMLTQYNDFLDPAPENKKNIFFAIQIALVNIVKGLGWFKDNDVLRIKLFDGFVMVLEKFQCYWSDFHIVFCGVLSLFKWQEKQAARLKKLLQEKLDVLDNKNPALSEAINLALAALAMQDEKSHLSDKQQAVLVENFAQDKIIGIFSSLILNLQQRDAIKNKVIENLKDLLGNMDSTLAMAKLSVARNLCLCFRGDLEVKKIFLVVFKECYVGQELDKLTEVIDSLIDDQKNEIVEFLKAKFQSWRKSFLDSTKKPVLNDFFVVKNFAGSGSTSFAT